MRTKKLLAILLTVCLAMPFISCTKAKDETNNGPEPDPDPTEQTDFDITEYGAVNSKTVYSTEAVQAAIDAASLAKGKVLIPAGDYLIAPVKMKSGMELYLEEGATLWGTGDRTKYNIPETKDINQSGERALIWAAGAKNISITGKGTIDGQGEAVAEHTGRLIASGDIDDSNSAAITTYLQSHDKFLNESPRPQEENRPMLIAFYDCDGVVIEGVTLKNSAAWGTTLWRCENAVLSDLTVRNLNFWNNDGIDLVDCKGATVKNCDVDSADDGICLKSYGLGYICDDITIEDCKVRSSASAIKFGTKSTGGFKNIAVKDIEVKNTFRSAVAVEAVDGGVIDNVTVSDITASDTWNAFCLIAGTRAGNSTISNVTFENISCSVPAAKPDAAYQNYTVAAKTNRNLCPALITGTPATKLLNIKVKGLDIVFAGGGVISVAEAGVGDLATIMDGKYGNYPEYDMFGELPAWGLLCRNVNGLELEDISLTLEAEDYRNPVVIDNVIDVTINTMDVVNEEKTPVVLNESNIVEIEGITSASNTSGEMYEVINPGLPTDPDYVIEEDGGFQVVRQYLGTGGAIVIPAWAEKIASSVFKGNSDITSVNLSNIIYVGSSCFEGCINLTEVNAPELTEIGEGSFKTCSSLGTVTGSKITKMANAAFQSCISLHSIDLSNVETMGQYVFFESKLKEVNMPNLTSILQRYTFRDCTELTIVNLPSVPSISSNATETPFSGCTKLEKVTLGVTTITVKIFPDDVAANIEELYLPNITNVGNDCCQNLTKLTKLEIPKVVTLGNDCFRYAGISSIDLPATFEEPATGGYFSGCTSLMSINVDPNNQNVKSVDGVLYTKDGTKLIAYPSGRGYGESAEPVSFKVPDGVTKLQRSAFAMCYFTSLDLNGVTETGDYSIYSCTKMSTILAPNLKIVGGNAFWSSYAFNYIALPAVVTINNQAFRGFAHDVIIDLSQASDLTTINGGTNAIPNNANVKILVKDQTMKDTFFSAYASATIAP